MNGGAETQARRAVGRSFSERKILNAKGDRKKIIGRARAQIFEWFEKTGWANPRPCMSVDDISKAEADGKFNEISRIMRERYQNGRGKGWFMFWCENAAAEGWMTEDGPPVPENEYHKHLCYKNAISETPAQKRSVIERLLRNALTPEGIREAAAI